MRAIQPGDVFCVYSEKITKYGAIQVTAELSGKASVVILDYLSDRMLKETELKSLKPRYTDRWFYDHNIEQYFTGSAQIASKFTFIGSTELVTNEKCISNTLWPTADIIEDIEDEYDWLQIPASIREPFKKEQKDPGEIILGGKTCKRNSGGVGDIVLSGLKDFSELDGLSYLARIYALHFYDGLIPYLQKRRMIRMLSLRSHGKKELDFRGTHLRAMELDGSGLEKLFINDSLNRLEIFGKISPSLKIISETNGRDLGYLHIHMGKGSSCDFDLPELKGLKLTGIGDFDLEQITGYRRIESLRLFGNPGNIINMEKLSLLPGLD